MVEFGADIVNDYAKYFSKNVIYRKTDVNGNFEFQDLRALSLEDNSVDAALTISVLQHIYELDAAISEIISVLKPGGKCLITNGFLFRVCMEQDFYRLSPAYWHRRLLDEAVDYEMIPIGNKYYSLENLLMRPYGSFGGVRLIIDKCLAIPFKILRKVYKKEDSSPLGVAVVIVKK